MGDSAEASPATQARTPHAPPPIREDCWSEDATSTLVDAWGRRYLELNRGNLRQKDWQEVADAVNARHGHVKKHRRTDVQCKNRIDTLKKKYKLEKARVSNSSSSSSPTAAAASSSPWPFFARLDALIGPHHSSSKKAAASEVTKARSPPIPVAVPVAPYRKTPPAAAAVLPQKRPPPRVPPADSYFRQNYSTLAAAAAAAAASADSEDELSEEESRSSGERSEKGGEAEGIRRLARAIAGFGEIFERVEGEKQRQMVELEKQRMQFVKDLEFQRMQMFMDTQVQLEKMKRTKRSSEEDGDDMYS